LSGKFEDARVSATITGDFIKPSVPGSESCTSFPADAKKPIR
jgi:hypothetical protein